MSKVYVGDIGTAIVLDTGTNLGTATAFSIEVRKPSGAVVSWAATVVETTKLRFVTVSGTLDEAGSWAMQAKVALPSGLWLGETATMTVYRPFA